VKVDMDPWDGYVADRNRVLGAAADRKVRSLVVITGGPAPELSRRPAAVVGGTGSPAVGAEFVGTSIASKGNGADLTADARTKRDSTPNLEFVNDQRGYCASTSARSGSRARSAWCPSWNSPAPPVTTRAVWDVEDGRPGVVEG
jgi:alkaline phosphatase D